MSVGYAPVEAPRRALLERINFRIVTFSAIVLLLVGFPVYTYLDSALSGGIKNIGNGFKEVDLKAMSSFAFDQINGSAEDIPKKWRELDGQKVVLYGEMYAPFSAGDSRLAGFDLCYSIQKCCVSGQPQVQHFVKSKVADNRRLPYYPNRVKVTGVLHVQVVRDPEANKVAQIYSMDVHDVEPG